MARDDKKPKTSPAPQVEGAMKTAVAAKKGEDQSKDKASSEANPSKPEGSKKSADSASGYSRGEGQKPVSKAYKDNWNAIFAKKKKKS
jgi:hypothetical protein